MPTNVTLSRKITCLSGADPADPLQVNVNQNRRDSKDIQLISLVPSAANSGAAFIMSAVVTPIVGIPNYTKSVRRLSVQAAPEGVDIARVITRGTRNPAQFRAELSIDVVRFLDSEISNSADKTLLVTDAFGCYANNPGASATLTLPSISNAQVKQAIGLKYFFFARNAQQLKVDVTGQNRIVDSGGNRHTEVSSSIDNASIAVRLEGRISGKTIWVAENASKSGITPDWSFA